MLPAAPSLSEAVADSCSALQLAEFPRVVCECWGTLACGVSDCVFELGGAVDWGPQAVSVVANTSIAV
ncbi:hypothetical protein GCM10025785_19700 [Corynebacterium canis]